MDHRSPGRLIAWRSLHGANVRSSGQVDFLDSPDDEKVLFLSDILPTGWMAADNCEIKPTDEVAVWGCGPVGLFAVHCALALGAQRVIAIDHYPHRLDLAKSLGAAVKLVLPNACQLP